MNKLIEQIKNNNKNSQVSQILKKDYNKEKNKQRGLQYNKKVDLIIIIQNHKNIHKNNKDQKVVK